MKEVRDNDPHRALAGLLAVQVHTGPPMKVQFKNVRLRQFDRLAWNAYPSEMRDRTHHCMKPTVLHQRVHDVA